MSVRVCPVCELARSRRKGAPVARRSFPPLGLSSVVTGTKGTRSGVERSEALRAVLAEPPYVVSSTSPRARGTSATQ